MLSFKQYFTEAIISDVIWYHGTTVDFDKFDYNYVMTDESNAQYGPGFYLTDSFDVASMYAGKGGFIKKVKLKRKGNIKNPKTKYTHDFVSNLINRKVPDKEVYLNWDENPEKGKYALYNNLIKYNDTLLEVVQSIWIDVYKNHEPYYCKRLVNNGLDGFLVSQMNGVNYLVVFTPDILKIVETIHY